MKYRVTCLTPLLVGDGGKLSPIDYMVWKDQVNVLDQQRIFRLLAKGPRLDSYLAQIKRADKLDFASWGGFAQNFAGRRIPFEHASCAVHWERARGDSVHIPTFVSGINGPYLPGSAVKGALRTGMLYRAMLDRNLDAVAAQYRGDRPPRWPAEIAEENLLGAGGASRTRTFGVADSPAISTASLKIYLLRVSVLQARAREQYELGWKQSPRGACDGGRPDDGTPYFAEMAAPETTFEGVWRESSFLAEEPIRRALRWREPASADSVFESANLWAEALLAQNRRYAAWAGLPLLDGALEKLEGRLAEARQSGNACLLSLGWGAGLLGKVAWLKTDDPQYREIIRQTPLYGRSIAPNLPFPKTRRIVFLENRPATLPGWVLLERLPG
jgi:CRISPR-associated protein Csm5